MFLQQIKVLIMKRPRQRYVLTTIAFSSKHLNRYSNDIGTIVGYICGCMSTDSAWKLERGMPYYKTVHCKIF